MVQEYWQGLYISHPLVNCRQRVLRMVPLLVHLQSFSALYLPLPYYGVPSRLGDIWYEGPCWVFHTICRGAVSWRCGVTYVYLGIAYVCFIPRPLPVIRRWAKWQQFFIRVLDVFKSPSKSMTKLMQILNLNGEYKKHIYKMGNACGVFFSDTTNSLWGSRRSD